MATEAPRDTAVIIPFPVPKRLETDSKQKARKSGLHHQIPYASTIFGSGWYHEAAIEDADPDRKR